MEREHMKCVGHYQKTKSLNYRNRRGEKNPRALNVIGQIFHKMIKENLPKLKTHLQRYKKHTEHPINKTRKETLKGISQVKHQKSTRKENILRAAREKQPPQVTNTGNLE